MLREDWHPFSQKSLDSGCGESPDGHVTEGKGSLDTHGALGGQASGVIMLLLRPRVRSHICAKESL